MGMILYRDGKPYVFEAIATVRYTPLASWIARGDGGHYVVKRLKQALTRAQAANCARRRSPTKASPTTCTSNGPTRASTAPSWSGRCISARSASKIGARQKLREFDLTDPAVKAKMRERYGSTCRSMSR